MTAETETSNPLLREQLSSLFGGYRAEWLGEKLFELFTAPDYLPELLTARPCFLIGGRGTGKTTVLRGLSYQGQRVLSPQADAPLSWPYFGFYYRVNTNRVAAFQGPELSSTGWVRAFSHYINLTFCQELLRFIRWLPNADPSIVDPSPDSLQLVAEGLHLGNAASVDDLADAIRRATVRFEAYINNVADGNSPLLSMLGQPIDLLCEAIRRVPTFQGKLFFFLIDEYENFADYQQEVLNTLIKQSGTLYTFKVGVKDLGLRRRSTLNPHEQLISPADYERIEIRARLQAGTFAEFARKVCNDRLRRIVSSAPVGKDVSIVLPGMSEASEAVLLGIESHIRELREELRGEASDQEIRDFDAMSPLEAYLVGFWARSRGISLHSALLEALSDRRVWGTRLDNYQHAILFTIRRRKRGIHKYYCGWDTFTLLADGNIRYLLQLTSESLLRHLDTTSSLQKQVSFDDQTLAAREVARKNLTELEGLAVNGAQLTRLVLGLGRIFQVMASQAEGHAPETNQFAISDAEYQIDLGDGPRENDSPRVDHVLTSAVMHQALVRSPANKLPGSSGDTKTYDYSLHPIFSPFFEYSHRRKRRMMLSIAEIIGLIEQPRATISAILRRTSRNPEEDLSEQLLLFAPYFNASS
jgi:hypothetical protein